MFQFAKLYIFLLPLQQKVKKMDAKVIFRYFKELTETQQRQFEQLDALYREWNAKINVI